MRYSGIVKIPGKKAQATLEYAFLIICIVAALAAMHKYFRRAISGGWRKSADEIGWQYAPGNTTGNSSQTLTNNSTTEVRVLGYDAADQVNAADTYMLKITADSPGTRLNQSSNYNYTETVGP